MKCSSRQVKVNQSSEFLLPTFVCKSSTDKKKMRVPFFIFAAKLQFISANTKFISLQPFAHSDANLSVLSLFSG